LANHVLMLVNQECTSMTLLNHLTGSHVISNLLHSVPDLVDENSVPQAALTARPSHIPIIGMHCERAMARTSRFKNCMVKRLQLDKHTSSYRFI